jgi:hypothetical protein
MEPQEAAGAAGPSRAGVGAILSFGERAGPSTGPPPGLFARRPWLAVALGVVAVLVAVSLTAPAAAPTSAAPAGGSSASFTAASSSVTCNKVKSIAPSSLFLSAKAPLKNLVKNGTIVGQLELEVVNFNSTNGSVPLELPSIFYKFPLAAGGNFSFDLAPMNFTVSSWGWTNATSLERTAVVPNGLVYRNDSYATLTSMKVAIMASDPYGSITLEARWRWANTATAGHTVFNDWSVPSNVSRSNPTDLPSIFYPASYADLTNSTGSVATIGANYSATLAGPGIGGQLFFLEMEYASGKVVQDYGQTAPANATSFVVTIPVINYNGALTPGLYLVHIHDACGALLYNKLIHAVFPAHATIDFAITPSVCGPIAFNGTSFANGTSGTFTPSTTSYNFSIPVCKGHSFHTWVTTGGLHIVSSGKLEVSASGTFEVEYN